MQEWLRGCRCSKVKCLKHYCVCFRNNVLCNRYVCDSPPHIHTHSHTRL